MLFTAKVKVGLVGLVVVGGGAVAALLGPAGLAVGQASQPLQVQIQVHSPGRLVAKGAGVDVPVTASCSGIFLQSGDISISLTEAVGKGLATGYGGAIIDCTGTTQKIDVLVIAQSGKAFARGKAIANAFISACAADVNGNCVSQQVEPVIKIRK